VAAMRKKVKGWVKLGKEMYVSVLEKERCDFKWKARKKYFQKIIFWKKLYRLFWRKKI